MPSKSLRAVTTPLVLSLRKAPNEAATRSGYSAVASASEYLNTCYRAAWSSKTANTLSARPATEAYVCLHGSSDCCSSSRWFSGSLCAWSRQRLSSLYRAGNLGIRVAGPTVTPCANELGCTSRSSDALNSRSRSEVHLEAPSHLLEHAADSDLFSPLSR